MQNKADSGFNFDFCHKDVFLIAKTNAREI